MENGLIPAPKCNNCAMCPESLFTGLSFDELSDMDRNKGWQFFKKGTYIFREGTEPKGVFVIFSGNVKISKLGEDGKEQIVRLAKSGGFIGYRALLCNDVYQASAIALEDTYLCFLKKEYYFNLIYTKPGFAASTIQTLTNDLRFAEHMMMNMAQKHVRGRIAEILLMLEEFYGIYEKDKTINTTIKREDIGHLVGTTTETSIRVISEFAKDNLIELCGKKIRITDRAKLIEISNRNI